jgi:adenylate cyclase
MDALVTDGDVLFQSWRFNRQARSLSRRSAEDIWEPVVIGSRAADILVLLLQQPGTLVSKDVIVATVWPGIFVEPNNLTVQIAALRRVLDAGRNGESCIQTVPGRGYRLLPEVRHMEMPRDLSQPTTPDLAPDDGFAASPVPGGSPDQSPASPQRVNSRRLKVWCAVLLAIFIAGVSVAGYGFFGREPGPPRLSIVVLPVTSTGDVSKSGRLAEEVGEDLIVALSQELGVSVSSHQATMRFSEQKVDPRTVGRFLHARYVLDVSLRGFSDRIRANVVLFSGETGDPLWMDQFDVAESERDLAEDVFVGWLTNSVYRRIATRDAARSERERHAEPDVFGLVLQARALRWQAESPPHVDQAQALYERALRLDPHSVPASAGLADIIVMRGILAEIGPTTSDTIRAEELTAVAERFGPTNVRTLWARAFLLRNESRWPEAEAAFERLIGMYPHLLGGAPAMMLGTCKYLVGRSEEAIPLLEKAIRIDRDVPYIGAWYAKLGQAYVITGRYKEAVPWLQRTLTASSGMTAENSAAMHYWLASAYALGGDTDRAREQIVQGHVGWPFASARTFMSGAVDNAAFAAQIDRVRDGLRTAGLRDHVDENEDGVAAASPELFAGRWSLTPKTIPGARTVRTAELPDLLSVPKTIVIDAANGSWTIPGAVTLTWVGVGGDLSDHVQVLLGEALRTLTSGDIARPIVVLSNSAEGTASYDLTVRAVALGYRNVMWYRGGRDAWGAVGLPMAVAVRLPMPAN